MEKYSNGDLEDTHEVESLENDVTLKSEVESVKEIPFEEDSELVNGGKDGDVSSSDSSSISTVEEVVELNEEILDSIEPVASLSDDLGQILDDPEQDLGTNVGTEMEEEIIELESVEMVENALHSSSDEIAEESPMPSSDDIVEGSHLVADVVELAMPFSDENNGIYPDLTDTNEVSNGGDESPLPSSKDIVVVAPMVSDVEGFAIPSSDENNGIPRDLIDVSKGNEETELAISDENIGTETVVSSLQPSIDVTPVVNIVDVQHRNTPEMPGNTGYSPIISISRRTLQPTSWRSCCGLFDVLRRSDR